MTGPGNDSSQRLDLSFTLAVGSLILFTGIFPSFLSRIYASVPQWFFLLLITLPAQSANIASCVIPARYCCRGMPLREVLDLKFPEDCDYPLIIPGTMAVYFILALVTGIAVFTLRKIGIQLQEQAAVEILRNGSPLLAGILIPVTVILAPIGEELCFRQAIYKKMEAHFGSFQAALLTALIFAAAHLNLQVFPALFLLSLWLSALYRKTGTLTASMMAHSLFNAMSVLLIYLSMAIK